MWDEEDGFYYDLLRLPDGSATRLKVRSLVGLLPLCATTVIEKWQRERVPNAMAYVQERLRRIPELSATIHPTGPGHFGVAERGVLALVNPERLRRILTKMLDENEFLGPHGIRSISKFHEQHPYVFHVDGQEYRVDYLPAESNTGMFGGNSNWRGPVWMPVNVLIIRALLNFYLYYGDNFKIECPTGSGKMMNLFEVSKEISDRLVSTFTRDEQGRRPVYGGTEKFQTDPHWRDYILFYEYFHGDNGAGLGRQPPDRLDRARGQAHRALRRPGSRACAGSGEEGRVRKRPQRRAQVRHTSSGCVRRECTIDPPQRIDGPAYVLHLRAHIPSALRLRKCVVARCRQWRKAGQQTRVTRDDPDCSSLSQMASFAASLKARRPFVANNSDVRLFFFFYVYSFKFIAGQGDEQMRTTAHSSVPPRPADPQAAIQPLWRGPRRLFCFRVGDPERSWAWTHEVLAVATGLSGPKVGSGGDR